MMDKKRRRSASIGNDEKQWASERREERKASFTADMLQRKRPISHQAEQEFLQGQRDARADELSEMKERATSRRKVAVHNMDLAGYMVRRAADGRSVEGNDLLNLFRGHQTVMETRQKLDRGRGNVTTDISSTRHLSTRFMKAGRALDTHLQGKYSEDWRISGASTAEFVRAGNCQEHADVSTHGHAQRLTSNQTVHTRSLKDPGDHVWSEVRGKDGKVRHNDVIVDAWAYGPAVLREDAYFAKDHTGSTTQYSYNKREVMKAAERVSSLNQALAKAPWADRFVEKRVDKLNKENYKAGGTFGPTSVLHERFMQRTDRLMKKPVDLNKVLSNTSLEQVGGIDTRRTLRNEIWSVGVARKLGSNIRQAIRQVPDIFKAAKKLPKN
ncbi:hypothetical protein [Paraburkholderia humisilvae]|uniref:Uncharacterized protein n=1 Tax=Paraburkholderia humisilvae TaxID=627669 RepID=A0A6J5DEG6_9BURK|nr:hypothetical protein [Paraburkholderia humisilvae]CAB3751206.1 hypothetical protein LMG29542_01438 [Paraburkholderia humisilvae]